MDKMSPIEWVDDFIDNATDEELNELLRKARVATTAEDIEMWEGDDGDFFPLPD